MHYKSPYYEYPKPYKTGGITRKAETLNKADLSHCPHCNSNHSSWYWIENMDLSCRYCGKNFPDFFNEKQNNFIEWVKAREKRYGAPVLLSDRERLETDGISKYYSHNYRMKHKNKLMEYDITYKRDNKEMLREKARLYREANREIIRERGTLYRETLDKEKTKEYRTKNKDRIREVSAIYRANRRLDKPLTQVVI